MKILRNLSIFYLVMLLVNCGNPQQPDNNFYQELQTDKSWYLDSAIKNGVFGNRQYPGPYSFVPVERQPSINLNEFQARIKQQYPIVNKQYNVIEGSVIIRVLVDIDKIVKAAVIEETVGIDANKVALEAVKRLPCLEVALQNNTPVPCWTTVSIYVSP